MAALTQGDPGLFSIGFSGDVRAENEGETVTLDLSHTLTLDQVAITDLQGNLIRGARYFSTSGDYIPVANDALVDPPANDVPAPSSLALLLAGLAALRLRRD